MHKAPVLFPIRSWIGAVVRVAAAAGPAWLTILASAALSLLGVYAIDVAESLEPHSFGELSGTAVRQLIFAGVGVMAAGAIALPKYRVFGYASYFLLAAAVALLVFLLLPFVPASIVHARKGARGWIDLGPVDLQPAELAKIAYVMALAWYLRYSKNHRTFKGLVPPGIITAIPVGLIMLQPDLGSAMLFVPTLFAVLVAAGAKLKHLTLIVALAVAAAPAAYPLLKPHQKERIHGLWLQLKGDTSQDLDINMQSVTAQRLIGAGGMVGVSDPHARVLLHYNALPERHNDMVFAVICTRFGGLGGLATLGLYAVWVVGALWVSAACYEPFGRLVCVGFAGFIVTQVFINVGMNLGVLPIIGITLPYVSHGGSSMVTVWLMTGLIASIAIRRPRTPQRPTFEYADE